MSDEQRSTIDDPNVRMPSAIKALSDAADAAYKAAYQPQEEEPKPAEEQSLAPPEQTPEQIKEQIEAQGEDKDYTKPKDSHESPHEEGGDWEHKYKSMKGRFDRLNEQVRMLSEQLSLAQHQQQAPHLSHKEAEAPPQKLITPEEERDYGTEFLNVVAKRAKEEFTPEVTRLERKVAELEAKLGNVGTKVATDARGRMEAFLDDKIPNWRGVNYDPKFLDWLKLPDAYSGVIRHDLLKTAYEQNRTPQVLAFFEGFLSEEAAVDPAKFNGASKAVVQPATPKPSLEDFAAPGRAKTAAGSSPPAEKPIITARQIDQFYADERRGVYRGRDADKLAIENMIFEAGREGRVRG
jgi:hypothetical protein